MSVLVAILLTALIMGFFWSEDHLRLTRERDAARALVHPQHRTLGGGR